MYCQGGGGSGHLAGCLPDIDTATSVLLTCLPEPFICKTHMPRCCCCPVLLQVPSPACARHPQASKPQHSTAHRIHITPPLTLMHRVLAATTGQPPHPHPPPPAAAADDDGSPRLPHRCMSHFVRVTMMCCGPSTRGRVLLTPTPGLRWTSASRVSTAAGTGMWRLRWARLSVGSCVFVGGVCMSFPGRRDKGNWKDSLLARRVDLELLSPRYLTM